MNAGRNCPIGNRDFCEERALRAQQRVKVSAKCENLQSFFFCQVQAIVRNTRAGEYPTRVDSAHRQETSLTVCFRAIYDQNV